jgi:integrase
MGSERDTARAGKPNSQEVNSAPDTWSIDQVNQLLATARGVSGEIAGIPASQWWSALFLVLLDVPQRLGAVLAAKRTDYDPQTRQLSVGFVTYALAPTVADALDAIHGVEREALFPAPCTRDALANRVRKLLKTAGLPHGRFLLHALFTLAKAEPESRGFPAVSISPLDRRAGKARKDGREDSSDFVEILSNAELVDLSVTPPSALDRVWRITLVENLFQFFDEVYAPVRLPDSSAQTIAMYRHTLQLFATFTAADPTFHNLNESCAEAFLIWLKQSNRMANATINKHRRQLAAIWKHAWRKHKVAELPRDLVQLTVPKRLPDAWSAEEVGRILAVAATTPGEFCGIPAGVWWTALILTAYDTGLRIDALLRARVADFDVTRRRLKVWAETQKQNADQAFALHTDTVSAILVTDPSTRELLFPSPFKDREKEPLRSRYRAILSAAGLAHGRRDLFHKLRRTSGTAIANAFDLETAQRHLGHSSPKVTASYLDPRLMKTKLSTAADSIERPTPPKGGPHVTE